MSGTGQKTIVFAEYHPWDSVVRVGGHHYAQQFADSGWRVLWLANFLNPWRLVRQSDYDIKYYQAWRCGLHHVSESIYTYTPFSLLPYVNVPLLSSQLAARACLHCCLPPLSTELKRHGFDEVDVLWVSQPRLYSLCSMVRYKFLAYRMFDEIGHFRGEPPTISKVEELLCHRADAVFTTSHPLEDKAKRWNNNVIYLPNAADVELFSIEYAVPDDLAQIPRPRLLYLGAVAEWLDTRLLGEVARQRRDWSLVLVGPTSPGLDASIEILSQHPNVHILGPKSHQDVPAYMQHCDIGLVPFRATELTHSVSPIKLYEYSAAGIPTVAARLDEIERCGAPVFLYDDCETFIAQAEHALSSCGLRSRLQAFASLNSWRARYRTIAHVVA